MNRSMVRSIFGFLVAIVLGITGCGGGGGGESSVTTPTGTVVNLQSFRNVYVGTTAGAQFSFPLTGSDSQGNTWFGSLTMTADGPMVYDGQNVTRLRTLTTLGITGYTPISSVSTDYWLAADGSAYKSIYDSGVVYTPTSSFVFPTTAQVGDYGTFPEIIGNDGTSIQGTWALKAGTNGSSMLEMYAINKTGTTVTGTELDTYYLDTAGVPTRIKIIATLSGITVTLTGNRS